MGIMAMLNAFRGHVPSRPARRPLQPSDASLKAEAELAKDRTEAMAANGRASMGVVLDATRALAAEARIRAMLGGMIGETDRGKGHDGRH